MENKHSFFERLEPMLCRRELARVRAAYIFSKFGHRAQTRKEKDAEGNPLRYFEHCRRTALIAIDECNNYDTNLICACLLHDCLEDTEDVTSEVIEEMFGEVVARWVTQLTKKGSKEEYFKRLRHMDKQAIVVKFCDRIDNIRSLPADDPKFIAKKLSETLEYFIGFKANVYPQDFFNIQTELLISSTINSIYTLGDPGFVIRSLDLSDDDRNYISKIFNLKFTT